ncbi:dihydrofolate reductase [Paenibacillus beijingensis]|uniref:Dihydrofolate reductase n=1 Tax=Paenibacillus beijingensis TaxID=1126833 RepID=A0A0D5NNZ2_9BACL|nr:dihydrofolate reductase [Paenibacillus beijingensis]AJY77049.1 dihydrofolate reductase [Paenibacillus beijingensis]
MSITLIAAMDRNRAIGTNNGLPWRLPADMKYFIRQTTGKTVLMGRKTFQSFGEKPLKDRRNVILTRSADYRPEGAETVSSIEEALGRYAGDGELMVIGGEDIYRQLLPYADRVLLTEIDEAFGGTDAYFPELDEREWKLDASVPGQRDEKNKYDFNFQTYVRI